MDKRLDGCCNEKEELKMIPEYKDLQNKKGLWHFEIYLLERKDVFKGHSVTVLVNNFPIRHFSLLMLLVGCLSDQE